MARGRRVNSTGRNVTERYVSLKHFLLDSAAWASLGGNSVKIYLAIHCRYNGRNNGEIGFSVREAKAIGIGKSSASEAMADLVNKGFLKVAQDSSFTFKSHLARLWTLTAEPVNGQPATRDFMKWKSKTQSALPDTQSAPADCETQNETKLPLTVRHSGPFKAKEGVAQSAGPDTSICQVGDKKKESVVVVTTHRAAGRPPVGTKNPLSISLEPLPTDWAPTDEHRRGAAEMGLDIEAEAASFRNRRKSDGLLSADWNAEFSIWLTRGAEYRATHGKSAASPAAPDKAIAEANKRNAAISMIRKGLPYPFVSDRFVQHLVDTGDVTADEARKSGFRVSINAG